MKRWVAWSLQVVSLFSTGCVARYHYRDDNRYRYYDDRGEYFRR
jgi:hypothetical protein